MSDKNNYAIGIKLLGVAFSSEHGPQLIDGQDTHDAALRLVAQLVRVGAEDHIIEGSVRGLLPKDYAGNTLEELPRIIAGARKKGFDRPDGAGETGFKMSEGGLVYVTADGVPLDISGSFEIIGRVRDVKSTGWARYIRWRDADGEEHRYIASDRSLLSEHEEVCGDLAHMGLRISRRQRPMLVEYILTSQTDIRLTRVYTTGWHRVGQSEVFVLPDQAIGREAEHVIFEADDSRHDDYSTRGSLADWRGSVSTPAGDHRHAALAISTSLAGPLIHLAGVEGGGIHFVGPSSTGKTTLLGLGASVWGPKSFIRSWRSTANGLEGIAGRTSDTTLILDELQQVDSKDAASSLYMLASGVGKIRMTRNATLREIKSWRVMVMSSGELTVEAKMTQVRGARAWTGATLRLLNVAADRGAGFGVFDSGGSTGDSGELVTTFEEATAENHGYAGPEFVKQLIERKIGAEEIRNSIADFARRQAGGKSGQVERAAKRFGLIATAGELATEFGITGWRPGTATRAAAEALKAWEEMRGGDSKDGAEERAAIRQVTSLIVTFGDSRFDALDDRGFPLEEEVTNAQGESYSRPPRLSQYRLGWRKGDGDERIWMVEDAIWESEFCKGFMPVQVSKALARHGMLKCAKGRFKYAERFAGKRNKRFTVITARILSHDYDWTEADQPEDEDEDENDKFEGRQPY